MTTERARLALTLTLTLLLMAAGVGGSSCASSSSVRHGDTLDVSGYPADIRAAYQVFAVRCSRCHTLARPLNARIHDEQHWVRYVTRMRRNPSSGINAKDAEIILRFLVYYMHQLDDGDRERDEQDVPPEPESHVAPKAAATPSQPDPAQVHPPASNDESSRVAPVAPAPVSDGPVEQPAAEGNP